MPALNAVAESIYTKYFILSYKSQNLMQSDPANDINVYDIIYPSFNAAIFYNEKGYVTQYTENRLNLSTPVVYTYIYENN